MAFSSFSETTKADLAQVIGERPCCLLSELAGFARVASRLVKEPGGKLGLEIRTENAAVARKAFRLVRAVFSGTVGVSTRQQRRFRRRKLFLIRVPGELNKVTAKLGLSNRFGHSLLGIRRVFLRRECCRRSYLRGLFLGGGWVSNTGEGYHLELLSPSAVLAQDIVVLLQRFGLKARYIERKNGFVVYLKESAAISDSLKLMGATGAILSLENARIFREVKNRINRLVNCETANLTRTVEASLRRKNEINLIISQIGLESLPLELRELARLRLVHPEATLKELGQLLSPPVSKSCVNHRLRSLAAVAGRLRRSAGGGPREGS
ncbi:MAG: DNA-binding protein WhiA [Ammonifex sp.]|nr:MAG: DNA-binding protein WhiA [Ammonifex sp.]